MPPFCWPKTKKGGHFVARRAGKKCPFLLNLPLIMKPFFKFLLNFSWQYPPVKIKGLPPISAALTFAFEATLFLVCGGNFHVEWVVWLRFRKRNHYKGGRNWACWYPSTAGPIIIGMGGGPMARLAEWPAAKFNCACCPVLRKSHT